MPAPRYCAAAAAGPSLYAEVTAGRAKSKRLLALPAGRYLSLCGSEGKLEKAPELFRELFAQSYSKVVVESELFTGDVRIHEPLYELRCALPRDA